MWIAGGQYTHQLRRQIEDRYRAAGSTATVFAAPSMTGQRIVAQLDRRAARSADAWVIAFDQEDDMTGLLIEPADATEAQCLGSLG